MQPLPPLDAILALSDSDRAALLASLSDATLCTLADPRSIRPVRTRKQALRVLADEVAIYALAATAGTH